MKPARGLSLLYCSGLAMLPFGAVYWPAGLGALAASPGLLVIAVAVLCLPFIRPGHRPLHRAVKTPMVLGIGIAGSLLSLITFGLSTLYVGKFAALLVLSLVWMSPLLMADVLDLRHVRKAMAAGLIICTAGLLLSDLLPTALPSAVRSAVFGGGMDQYLDDRPRGFTDEPSSYATLVGRMLFIYFLIVEARRRYNALRLMTFLIALAVGLVALGSKGAVVSIALGLLAAGLGRRQWKYLLLLAPASLWVASTQLEAVTVDLEQFTSISTRAGMWLTGLASAAMNPLGYGYYGFYGAIQTFGQWAMGWLGNIFPFRFNEMSEIVDDLINVSTKSTTLDMLMMLGWAFLWLLWKVFKRIDVKDPRARAALTYFLVTSLYTSANASVLFFLGLVVLMRLFPTTARPVRRHGTGRPPTTSLQRPAQGPLGPCAAQS